MELIYKYPIQIVLFAGTTNKILLIQPEEGAAFFPFLYLQSELTIRECAGQLLIKHTKIDPIWTQLRLNHIFDSPDRRDKQGRRYVTIILSCLLPEIAELYYNAQWKSIQAMSELEMLPDHKKMWTEFTLMGGF